MPCRFGNAAFAFALLGYRRDSHARANHGFYAGGEVSSQGLVSYGVGVDRRHKAISLTEKGEVSAALVTGKLGRVTAELYAGVDASLKSKTNELHMRMYATYSRA